MAKTKYVVISYDDDQQQWFDDTVLAADGDSACAFILETRPYVISARSYSQEDLTYMCAVMTRPADFEVPNA